LPRRYCARNEFQKKTEYALAAHLCRDGWSGENIGNPVIALYGYDAAGSSKIERRYSYDDHGRDNLFEFTLEESRYQVTLGAGRPAEFAPMTRTP
jgi:hypothetical protein